MSPEHSTSKSSSLSLEEIQAAMQDEVLPYVHSHGGYVELLGFEGATLRLRLAGACERCSAQNITLRAGIERILRRRFSEIDRVVLVA